MKYSRDNRIAYKEAICLECKATCNNEIEVSDEIVRCLDYIKREQIARNPKNGLLKL
jgi:hypothetical protein